MSTLPNWEPGAKSWPFAYLYPETAVMLEKAAYIAALERCAGWHKRQEMALRRSPINELDLANAQYAYGLQQEIGAHKESAAQIRQWIEEEKKKK